MWDHLMPPAGPASIVDPLLAWAAEATVVAAALAAFASLAGRSRSLEARPATRHTLWLLVLIKLATPPLLAWPWPVPRPGLAGLATPGVAPEPVVRTSRPRGDAPPSSPGGTMPGNPAATRGGPTAVAPGRTALRRPGPAMMPGWRAWLAVAWLGGGLALAARQAGRVLRFRRCLADATPAPGWLLAEVGDVGRRLGVAAPPVRVVRPLGTPVLWCLGRPTILVPERMLATLARDGWPAILAHELAHLRRGDPWVRRLALVAGLVWWWNPLYWLARRRLDFEAELACDAWAVWAAPRGRIAYAESLIRICAGLSPAGPPTPALGVAGTGRSFERRLTMILRNRSHHRLATPHRLAAALLAGLALPSWVWADPASADDSAPAARIDRDASRDIGRTVPAEAPAADPDLHPSFDPDFDLDLDDDPESDDEQRDDAGEKDAAKARDREIKADVRAKASSRRADGKVKAETGKADEQRQAEMAKFVKQMEAMGKEMEAKFGPGSDFAKNIEKTFGPDSDFAKGIEKDFGPGSAFAKGLAEMAAPKHVEPKKAAERSRDGAQEVATKDEADEVRDTEGKKKSATRTRTENRSRGRSEADRRASRIDALEARINGLMAELERLKADSDDEDDQD